MTGDAHEPLEYYSPPSGLRMDGIREGTSVQPTVVIPTFWTRRRSRGLDRANIRFDHPTPLGEEGTLPTCLKSLETVDGLGRVVVIVAVTDAAIEHAAEDRVLDVLTSLFLTRGVPRHIRSDNGPEFIAHAIRRHGEQAGLEMLYIEPGSPWENGFAESFFSRLRGELLNCEEFANLAEARWFARRRQEEHNHERPHSSLGYQTPSAFAAACAASAPAAPALQQHTRIQEEDEETLLPVPQPILS